MLKDVTVRATRRVTHYNQSLTEETEANDPLLAVVLALVFSFERRPSKDLRSVREVQPALDQRQISLGRVIGDFHSVNVSTKTTDDNQWLLMTQNVRAKRATCRWRSA